MAGRRLLYLTALTGATVFYWAYREWLSGLLLLSLLLLPWFSLLVSLPAMLSCRAVIHCDARLTQGQQATAAFTGKGSLPMPQIRGKLLLKQPLTGNIRRIPSGAALPTDHCGSITVAPGRVWVWDYLGLLRLPIFKKESLTVPVFPKPVPLEPVPDLSRYLAAAFRSKPGGGFAEHHDLRLYRPGDSLRQIHWKLSAKTGKLISREPMEALQGLALVSLELRGTPTQLDRKLGQTLWLCRYLLARQVKHRLHCLTGAGMESFFIDSEESLDNAMVHLLGACPAGRDMTPTYISSTWRCHIGGDSHEP